MNIFFVVLLSTVHFTWEFLGDPNLELLIGFVNAYQMNRCCE